MPIYFRSKQVKDLNFLKHNGKSYTRTGKHVPKSSTVTTPLSDCEPFYVTSCSATDFGNQIVIPGGTVTVPYSATEFQLKFTGKNAGDSGFLILEDSVGRTCTVQLSVNALSALVFDVQETGVPSPHTFDKLSHPSTINYVDCMSHKWDITYAAQGSYYVTLYYKGTSIFKCGQAEIDTTAIYKIGSDSRTGLGGQVNANIEQTSSVGYSLQYKTLNYGVDTANGSTGMPVILQDLVEPGEDVIIYMKGTNGTGPQWETATGENLNTHEWGLSTTAGGFNNGNSWDKLTFPTGTYSTSATIMHGNSARICFAGTTPTTPGTTGDKHFTILKELIDIKSVPVGSTTPVTVEHDGETFIKFEGVNTNDAATVKFTSPVGMTCDVEMKIDASGDLVFDTQSTGSGPLTYTSFPQTQQYTDCHGDQYDVTFTGLGSFHVTVSNMLPFTKTNTGIAKIDNRTDAAWYNYNIVGASGGKYNLAKENWSSIKTPTTYQPVAQVIEDNPDIVMTIGDGLTFTSPNSSLHSVVDAHPMWIKTVQSPGQPGPGEIPDGVIINNGIAPQWVNYRFIRFRPTTPGTYYYNCEHHASMTGKIIVNDVSVSPIVPTPTPTPTDAAISPPGGSTALEDNLTGIDKWWVVGARGTPSTSLTNNWNQSMSGRYVSGGGYGHTEFDAAVTAAVGQPECQ